MDLNPFLKRSPYILETLPLSIYIGLFSFCDGSRDIALCSVYEENGIPMSQINFSKNHSYRAYCEGGYKIDGIADTKEILSSIKPSQVNWSKIPLTAQQEGCLGLSLTLCSNDKGALSTQLGLLYYREVEEGFFGLETLWVGDSDLPQDISLHNNEQMKPQAFIQFNY